MGNGASRPRRPNAEACAQEPSATPTTDAAVASSPASPRTGSQAPATEDAAATGATSTDRPWPLSLTGARPTRQNLETTVTSLMDELRQAKAKVVSTERKLEDMEKAAENKGVPSTECLVCLNACVNAVLVPCGHLCMCVACANTLQTNTKSAFSCPLCRMQVANIHRVYLPIEQPPPKPKKITTPRSTKSAAAKAQPAAEMGVQTSPEPRRAQAADSTSVGASPLSVASDVDNPSPPQFRPRPAILAAAQAKQRGRLLPAQFNAAVRAMDDMDGPLPARVLRARIPSQLNAAPRPPAATGESPGTRAAAENDGESGTSNSTTSMTSSVEQTPETFDFVVPGGWEPSALMAATWG